MIARGFWHAFCAVLLIACTLLAVEEAHAQDTRPAPFGACSSYVTSDSVGLLHADGVWFAWHCVDAYGVTTHWRAWRYDFKLKAPAAASTPAGVFDAFQAANMKTPAGDPSLAGLRSAAESWLAKNSPPVPRWLVAKNSTSETRPTYDRNPDGTLGPETVIRATVGIRCHCEAAALRVIKGTTTYCEARGDGAPLPAVVAVCTRAAP